MAGEGVRVNGNMAHMAHMLTPTPSNTTCNTTAGALFNNHHFLFLFLFYRPRIASTSSNSCGAWFCANQRGRWYGR